MKKNIFIAPFLAVLCLHLWSLDANGQPAHKFKEGSTASGIGKSAAYPLLPGPGKKISIDKDYYFIFGFDKKPKIGTVILKVEIFNRDGKKDTSLEVKADAGMPSMRGAHETGERSLKLSQKGDYLIPIDLVMPGDWEIRLTFLKDGKIIFRGSYTFDV
jgi:hypothetical protein